MKLCPVDLAACDRAHCRGGHCELAETRQLVICWECGKLEGEGIVHGICVECIAVTTREVPEESTTNTSSPARG